MSNVTLQGHPLTLEGVFPQVGEIAKDIELTGGDLVEYNFASFAGKRLVLNIVPSLDTPTCAVSTRQFNQMAAQMSNTQVLAISADLPFAAKRFCTAEGIENVMTLSNFRNSAFASDYGVAIASGPLNGLTARAVVVIGVEREVLHAELVAEIGQEPDYEAALAVLG